MSKLLRNFLGEARWRALWSAIRAQEAIDPEPRIGFDALFSAFLVTLTPVIITYVDSLRPLETTKSILPTIAFGICALLALLLRSRLGLTFQKTRNWRQSLSLTHTAVALGCVPALLVLLISKTMLADRHDVLTQAAGGVESAYQPTLLFKIGIVLAFAAWVALTEELIFRGLLVSVIRRATILKSQRQRDILACISSSLIFGLAHWPTWGPAAAIALAGLGFGFVLAYIANGEQLMPLVIYHFIFDALSLAVSVSW